MSSVEPQSVYLSINTRSPSSLLRLVDEEEEGEAGLPPKNEELSESIY